MFLTECYGSIVQYTVEYPYIQQYVTACCMVRYDMPWHCRAKHGMTTLPFVFNDMAWAMGMAQFGMVW